jgi:ribosomal protein L23
LEKIFQVTITDLNTSVLPIKMRRVGKFVGKRARYKKAYIKVKVNNKK